MRKQKAAELLEVALKAQDLGHANITALCELMKAGKPYQQVTDSSDPITEIVYNALHNAGAHDDGEHFASLDYAKDQINNAIRAMSESPYGILETPED